MKTIVTATDFSTISLNAAFYAADLAGLVNANLTLIHVCTLPIALGVGEVATPVFSIEEMIDDAEERLTELKESIYEKTGTGITIHTEVKQGNVVTEIREYCLTQDIYAIVMGAETGAAWERMFFGAKAISALKQFTWPLIIVPSDTKFRALRKIGLACDFRKVIETLPLKEIRNLIEKFHAELHVLHVSMESGDSFDVETVQESGWLQDMIGDLKPRYHFLKGKEIEKVLVEFSETLELDLLIIIPKKHSLLNKLFQHSHSKRLVLQSHVPVMAIHD